MNNLEIIGLGQLLDDIEGARIAAANRQRSSELPHPALDHALAEAERLEDLLRKSITKAWKRHALAPWAATVPGAGAVLMARLIASIGDPSERPNVAKLWAYCGHGEPTRRRARGMSQAEAFACGSPHAKTRVYLLAVQFRRTPASPYRAAYLAYREQYADRVHERACVRCGPSGHPAKPGSPWSLGHQDAAALRRVGKDFLKDVWIAARELHIRSEDQRPHEFAGGEACAA